MSHTGTLAVPAAAAGPAPAQAAILAPPLALFGLPSLHSIIQAIAGGFFTALAQALVPGWLRHGTVATIQHLVALPDPATWRHVGELQGEMTYLAAMLLPVTLAVGATRYWLIGITGSAHPASAVVRSAASSGVLVAYRWIVEQTVAATNTLTHGILGLPSVAAGLQRIIGVLFGGALLAGAGGVFGALLVIVGVLFAAGLFAAQVLITLALAVLIVAGPPLIVLASIPELAHLARGWSDALLAVALVPVGWSVLFATAGALCLDATSFTGAGGGVPGHVAAAFAGLITFVLAVRLPFIAVGEIRAIFTRHGPRAAAGSPQASTGTLPAQQRVRAAQARLRAAALAGAPAIGASVGRAAGALGAPAGGPLGAARRRLAHAATGRSGTPTTASRPGAHPQGVPGGGAARPRLRERLAAARAILAGAPAEARAAMRPEPRTVQGARAASRQAAAGQTRTPNRSSGQGTPSPRSETRSPERPASAGSSTSGPRGSAPGAIRRAHHGRAIDSTGGAPAREPRRDTTPSPTPPRPETHQATRQTSSTRAPQADRTAGRASRAPAGPQKPAPARRTAPAARQASGASETRQRASRRKPRSGGTA